MVTREEFVENQQKNKPVFMNLPSGRCWSCKYDIIPTLIERGHNGEELITGCPLCNRSYVS
jgi:hypothetical protein